MNERTDVRGHKSAHAPTRRTVVRSAAWAVPAVAAVSAAPAFAASEVCTTYSVGTFPLTDGQVTNGRRNWSRTFAPSGGAPSITMWGAFTNPVMAGNTTNRMGVLNSQGDRNNYTFDTASTAHGAGLRLAQRRGNGNHSAGQNQQARHMGVWTFSFSHAVNNLRFTLSDIDNSSGDFNDRVYVQPGAGATASVVWRGANIPSGWNAPTGLTQASALYSSTQGDINLSSDRGSATYQFSGATDRFTVYYWNNLQQAGSSRVDNDQWILLTDLSLNYEVCV